MLDVFFISLIVVILISFIYWSTNTKVEESVKATGIVKFKKKTQEVQHEEGGVVSELFVKNGQRVEIGDVLFTLDGSRSQIEASKQRQRLHGLRKQIKQKKKQLPLREKMVSRGLATKLSLLEFNSEIIDLEAQAHDIRTQLSGHRMMLKRLRAKAHFSGIVHNLSIEKGSVITSGASVMQITPGDGVLHAEVSIPAQEIGMIRVGQTTHTTFTSFDFSRYGSIPGTLASLAPTSVKDEQGEILYMATIEFDRTNLKENLSGPEIRSGMTMIADIKIGEKTVAEYLLKPIFASARKALTEK